MLPAPGSPCGELLANEVPRHRPAAQTCGGDDLGFFLGGLEGLAASFGRGTMPGSHGLGAFPWILWVPKAPECRNAGVRDALMCVIPCYKGLGQYSCWK